MKSHDRTALAVYRSALAAIDNAEAIPMTGEQHAGAIEATEVGIGRAEAPRQHLSEQDVINIVAADAAERVTIAGVLAATVPDRAQDLLHEAALLHALVERASARRP